MREGLQQSSLDLSKLLIKVYITSKHPLKINGAQAHGSLGNTWPTSSMLKGIEFYM